MYIPSDHRIAISDDDEDNDDEKWTDEQIFLHFLLIIKIFESEKIFVIVFFLVTTKKYCDGLELQYKSYLLFLITHHLKKKSFVNIWKRLIREN